MGSGRCDSQSGRGCQQEARRGQRKSAWESCSASSCFPPRSAPPHRPMSILGHQEHSTTGWDAKAEVKVWAGAPPEALGRVCPPVPSGALLAPQDNLPQGRCCLALQAPGWGHSPQGSPDPCLCPLSSVSASLLGPP